MVGPLAKQGIPTAKSGRDDFSAKTKQLLAQRVGWLCSNPECCRPTLGPRMGEPGIMNLGVAAHIMAASEGGPRYDKLQTAEERRSFANGLWLCQSHAHQIDHDKAYFTVKMLEDWKRSAEQRAFDQLSGAGDDARVHGPSDELIEEMREVVMALGLPVAENLETVTLKVKAAARIHLNGFHHGSSWPRHLIALFLLEEGAKSTANRFTATRLGELIQAVQEIVLIASPGTGKTTTLLQTADALLLADTVPVFVPLREWAESSGGLFTWAVNRIGFQGVRTEHLKFLAHHGRLTLLLDGWNEVPAPTRRRLIVELEGLRRDYPLLSVVMSTRRQAVGVPLDNPRRLTILQLSEGQQEELAEGLAGADGLNVLDRAWRTAGLRDLVNNPLYLMVLLKVSPGGYLPETREEVLRRFVEEHENDATKADAFQIQLLGNQQHYLSGLAVEAHVQANTVLNGLTAQQAVGKVNEDLISTFVVQIPPNPTSVIDVLVSTHTLERDATGNISFQHQQFQEWYASHYFEQELRQASLPLSLTHPLAIDRLNDPNWGEAVLFACERLSRDGNRGEQLVAAVIDVLLQIDPLFAATVIRRSSLAVWKVVAVRVQAFAKQWHKTGEVDRGLGFMITTGRAEFSDVVWPMVTSADQQTQLRSLRVIYRFDPTVLGERLASDYAALPEGIRSTLLGELIDNGGSAGIDTAINTVLQDASIVVRHHVFESLNFRAAGRQAEELLRQSTDELVDVVAAKGYFDEVTAPDLLEKLSASKQNQNKVRASANHRLTRLIHSPPSADRTQQIAGLLADPTFNYESNAAKNALYDVAREMPNLLEVALVDLIEAGIELPWHVKGYLNELITRDTGAVREFLSTPGTDLAKGAALVAGQDLTHDLCRRYLISYAEALLQNGNTTEERRSLRDLEIAIESTPTSSFYSAITRFGPEIPLEDIGRLCDLIVRHGRDSDRKPPRLSPELLSKVAGTLKGWAEVMLSSDSNRQYLGDVARAMCCIPDPSHVGVLDRMLRRDQEVYVEARRAYLSDRRNQDAMQDAQTSYETAYRDALVVIGTDEASTVLTDHLPDPYFGAEAAVGLMLIWRKRNDRQYPIRTRNWPNAEVIIANRAFRRIDPTATTVEAETIFAQVLVFLDQGGPENLQRAAAMAGSAILMPHGDKSYDLERLLISGLSARSSYDLISHMAAGGIIVKASDVMSGLDSAIAEIEDRQWTSEQDAWVLERWLQLFPCSDDPRKLLVAIEKQLKTITWRHMREVLHLAAATAGNAAPDVLRGLVVGFPELAKQYELQLALLNQPLGVLLDIMLDIASGTIGDGQGLKVAYRYPEQIFETLSPSGVREVVRRYKGEQPGPRKAFLGQILLTANDPEIFLMLAADASGRSAVEGCLWATLQDLLHDKLSVFGARDHYELIPRGSSLLRGGLFALTQSDDQASVAFGKRSLTIVDEIRDENGITGMEPRHPHILSGIPWPNVIVNNAGKA
ncbi:MAG: hypothetical protein JKY99_00040 [Rhizobiales bacterium]|nr:hypothetical protein [Hyphomicrobiales bacterium]